jgi:hypothetical protein
MVGWGLKKEEASRPEWKELEEKGRRIAFWKDYRDPMVILTV